MGIVIQTNKYQTPITDELLDSLNNEIKEQFLDIVTNIKFIKNLISPNRLDISECPRDNEGKAIIDLANPPIISDVEYFYETRKYFEENGCYTKLKPNGNPNSEYGKWLRRERNRCWNGMLRKSDGAWITGLMYWMLNYCPMMVNKQVEGTNFANRVEGYADWWEGLFWRFHYLQQARFGGLYNNFKGGQHAAELARRGCGKSYSLAAIMSHNLILGESQLSHKRFITILTAYLKEYLAEKDGTMTKFTPILDHCATFTQFPRLKIVDSPNKMAWQMGFRDSETNAIRGSKNSVAGVACKDNTDKLRGKRGYILFEEFGSFKNLTATYNTVRDSVEEAGIAFAMMYLVGTSGNSESDFQGAKELICSPDGYNIYGIPNVFDKPNQGSPKFSFFFPSYINRKGFYNKDGISDVVGALIDILKERYKVKYNTKDPNTIIKKIAEQPITPAEAILRVKRNLFPTTQINERIMQIESNPAFYNGVYTGSLEFDKNNNLHFISTNAEVIRHFPHDDNKIEGAIEIFNMPEKNSDNKVFSNRYLAGADPYDDDSSETMSLGSIFILDGFTDKIVAEYTGRPMFADEYYEICRKLCLFYNARLNYENNKKGLYTYFTQMNCTYLLTETLESLKDKSLVKVSYGNKNVGTNATAFINNYARERIREWLLKPVATTTKDDNNNEIETTIPNLFFINNLALLKELSQWTPEGNYDRVSALGMLMLLREDRVAQYQGNLKKASVERTNYLGDSKFFQQYDRKFRKN